MQAVFHGITIAAVSGLLFGTAFKPNVAEGGLIPPQIQMREGADRLDRDAGGFAFASRYGAQTPDYVLGTDWTKPLQVATNEADYGAYEATDYQPYVPVEPVSAVRPEYARANPRIVPVAYPAVEHSYPSMGGDILPPRQAPAASDVVDVEPVEVKAPIVVEQAVTPEPAPMTLASLD